jgi:hypothetical protein
VVALRRLEAIQSLPSVSSALDPLGHDKSGEKYTAPPCDQRAYYKYRPPQQLMLQVASDQSLAARSLHAKMRGVNDRQRFAVVLAFPEVGLITTVTYFTFLIDQVPYGRS